MTAKTHKKGSSNTKRHNKDITIKSKSKKVFLDRCVKAYAKMVEDKQDLMKSVDQHMDGQEVDIWDKCGNLIKTVVRKDGKWIDKKPEFEQLEKVESWLKVIEEKTEENYAPSDVEISVNNSECDYFDEDDNEIIVNPTLEDVKKAITQAEQRGADTMAVMMKGTVKQELGKLCEQARAEGEAACEKKYHDELGKQLESEYCDVTDLYCSLLREANDRVSSAEKRSKEEMIKIVKEEHEKYAKGNTSRIAASRFADIILKRLTDQR